MKKVLSVVLAAAIAGALVSTPAYADNSEEVIIGVMGGVIGGLVLGDVLNRPRYVEPVPRYVEPIRVYEDPYYYEEPVYERVCRTFIKTYIDRYDNVRKKKVRRCELIRVD